MNETQFDLAEAMSLLARTPILLDSWLRDLPPKWLAATEGESTYSPQDVVGHLLDGEEVDWIPRVRLILERGEKHPFTPFDREAFRERFGGWSIAGLLDAFAERRASNLATLAEQGLTTADLSRTGAHPSLGRVTLEQLLAAWVTHDLTHIAQIARVMAKRYGQSVGPWHAYMGVLSDRTATARDG